MAVAFPPPLVPIAGASDREGRSRRNRHQWIAPSRGIIPISLFGVRVALIGSRSARYFSPTCSPRARMSAFMTCHLIMDPPPPMLRPLPSSPAGFRSTFDRLPYGCLLFMYRLDLTVGKPGGKPLRLTASVKIARARPDRFWPAYPFLCVCV
jgi:hypothetical protein